ncbi:hypothetical protein COL922a_008221 [Colletotrichum nupharicola]|nr:hypothetical protein COL922a_008221 [Colletotrichum nupharicola]
MRSDSDTETDSAVLPPPTTANEKQHKPSTSDSVSNSATTVAEKEWVKHEDAAEQEERMNNEVLQLARRFTTQSHGAPGAFPNFNARKWAKAFYDIRTDTSEGNPPKTTGIAFKDLNVFGFGTSTDY